MIPNMATIGVRFDIGKVRSGYYGADCWKVFWRAIEPEELKGAVLFEGDTDATLSGTENVFCIAVQSMNPSIARKVKNALSQSKGFRKVCASPMFIEGSECVREPLPIAGKIDASGSLVGEAPHSRPALGDIRKERQSATQAAIEPTTSAKRCKPASSRTRDLPVLSSFGELEKFLEQNFTTREIDYTYWLTPEELCDVVERYAALIEVQFSEDSCGLSEDAAYVHLFQKYPPEGNPIAFIGMFAFPSVSDAANYWKEIGSKPTLAKIVPKLAGIQGKWHLNFAEDYGNPRDITYEKENDIAPDLLWMRICARRERLGIPKPAPISKRSGVKRSSRPHAAQVPTDKKRRPPTKASPKNKWWEFWK